MLEMTLREVCQNLGVSRRAVQGYEKAKLVSASRKTNSGYLLYNAASRERIKQIKLFQDMGFTIKEISSIIDAPDDIKRTALIVQKEKLAKNIVHEKAMIKIIQEMLSHL